MVASLHREELVYPAVLAGTIRIDSDGRIWRGAKRAENDIGKYLQVRVMRDRIRHHALAHRLVWLHFKGPIPGSLLVNHKDGNGKNNHPDNLELASSSGNTLHAVHTLKRGRTANQSGEANHSSKLTAQDVVAIRRRRAQGERLKAIAADFGVSDRTISKIARGQLWTGS